MPEKKEREQKKVWDGEGKFRHLLKRELMKWYCGALYSGRVKAEGRSDRPSCSAKKA